MYSYFLFDGTQTVNGASAKSISDSFGWTSAAQLWFITRDGTPTQYLWGPEDAVRARILELEGETPDEPDTDTLKLLRAQLAAQSDRADFLEDCIAEMAAQIYA